MTAAGISVHSGDILQAVPEYEYRRLLGMPRDKELEGDLLERAESAKQWYLAYGKPFAAYRRVEIAKIDPPAVFLSSSHELQSNVLAQRLRAGEANALFVLATSAGPEVSAEVARRWKEGLPDEAYFLDRLAVAITEQLVFYSAGVLCRAAEPAQETMLPHLSPGCGNWDITDQHQLWSMLTGGSQDHALGPITIEETGALYPQHSYLAVSGITKRKYAASPRELCRMCDLKPCAFRRAPYQGEALQSVETQ